jgi:hypothetical protein
MTRPKYALALILVLWPAASRAQDCKIRFSVAYSDGKDLQVGLTADQTKFWQRDAEKRYKGLCLDTEKPEYLIYWTEDVSGDVLVQSAVQDLNRVKRSASTSVTQRYGPEGSTLRVLPNPVVREAAYYFVLDLSKQPPEVIRKGAGSQDRPAETSHSSRVSGGSATVGRSQEMNSTDLSKTIADPVAAMKSALDWLKKKT